jgi:hypothetical protein
VLSPGFEESKKKDSDHNKSEFSVSISSFKKSNILKRCEIEKKDRKNKKKNSQLS